MTSGRFAACMDGIDEGLAFVDAFCQAEGIAHGDALRLRLVVEELFTNAVEHGAPAATTIEIELATAGGDAAITLDYADDGAPFDPRPVAAAPTGDPAAADARPGGIGLKLLARFCSHIGYARDADRNRLRLTLPRRGG